MKKNLQRFGASVLAAAMVAQSVALPAAAETTKIDSSVAQSVAASAASAASAVQSLPKFTSTADLIKQTAQTLAAQGEVHELEQDDAKLEATAQSKAGMSLAALENALADAMYANAAAGKINTEAYGLNKDEMASVMAATIKTYHLSSAVTDLGYETNAAGVVTAVTFTGSSGMTSAMESMTNSDDEVIAQQADSYAQAYVAENSDTFAASAAADGHTYGEPKWWPMPTSRASRTSSLLSCRMMSTRAASCRTCTSSSKMATPWTMCAIRSMPACRNVTCVRWRFSPYRNARSSTSRPTVLA